MKTLVFRNLWSWICESKPASYAVSFYLFVVLCDWGSSLSNNGDPTVTETNPFVRNAAMEFVLRKGVIVDFFFFVAFALVSLLIYQAVKGFHLTLAKTLSASFLLYIAADRLLTAVVPNVLLRLHLFVSDTRHLLR